MSSLICFGERRPCEWEITSDVELLSDLSLCEKLEIVPFLGKGEDRIAGGELIRRAKELKANLGLKHAERLVVRYSCGGIPRDFQDYNLVFPGTIIQFWPSGARRIPALTCHRSGCLYPTFFSLEDHSWVCRGFDKRDRLVRPAG